MARTSSPHHQLHRIERKQRKPMARNAANARERSRMRILSRAFSRLKTALPWVPADTKLSKLDTLRLASSYIAYLCRLLTSVRDSEEQHAPGQQEYSIMSWPFSANQPIRGEEGSQGTEDLKREQDSGCADSDAGADWSSSGETGVQEILY